jgi:hypothetical protein
MRARHDTRQGQGSTSHRPRYAVCAICALWMIQASGRAGGKPSDLLGGPDKIDGVGVESHQLVAFGFELRLEGARNVEWNQEGVHAHLLSRMTFCAWTRPHVCVRISCARMRDFCV